LSERWVDRAVICCGAALLLWACYDYGAFLQPAKTAVAVAAPTLGLLWILARGAAGRRLLRAGAGGAEAESSSAEAAACAAVTAETGALVDRVEAGGAPGGGAVAGPTGRAAEVRWSLPETLLYGLASFGALSALWSLDWADSLRASGILFGGCFYLHLGRHVGAAPSGARRALLWLVAATGIVISVFSVVGYALRWWRFSLEKDGVLAATGTFGYANALAGLLLLTLAATMAVSLETRGGPRLSSIRLAASGRFGPQATRRRTGGRLAQTAAIGIQVAALVLTWSKGAAVVAVFLLLLWLAARSFAASDRAHRRRWLGVLLAILLAAGLATGGALLWKDVAPQMAVSGLPPSDADPEDVVPMTSNAFRIKTWSAALEAAGRRPVAGWGLDTFYAAYSPFKLGGHTAYAHNVVIQHLVEVGGIGTALLLAFLLVATLRPARTLLGPRGDPRIPLVLGVQAFALHNLVDLTWYFPALFFIFTLLLGLTTSSPGRRTTPTGRSSD
jgi:O-antigen ligase